MKTVKDIAITLCISLILLIIFFIFNIATVHAIKPEIYFYFSLKELLACCLLFILTLYVIRNKLKINIGQIIYGIIIFVTTSYIIIITLIVTIDRSFSIHMLSTIYNTLENNQRTHISDLSIITKSYINGNHMFQKRINEQLATGSITIDKSGEISMTNRGKFIVYLNKIIGYLFNLDEKNFDPKINKSNKK